MSEPDDVVQLYPQDYPDPNFWRGYRYALAITAGLVAATLGCCFGAWVLLPY